MIQPLPMPSADDHDRYRQLLQSWAAYTGLDEDDPYIKVTCHIYALCLQVSEHEANTQQILFRLDDRLNRIEQFMIAFDDRLTPEIQSSAIDSDQPTNPNILQMLCEISDKLDKSRPPKNIKDPSYDLHKGHILLILRGLRMLVVMTEKLTNGTSNSPPPVGNVDHDVAIETNNLNAAMLKTGYGFRPLGQGRKFMTWLRFAFHDLDGKWLLKFGGLMIVLPITGLSIGFGQHYAKSNHWFENPPVQQPSLRK